MRAGNAETWAPVVGYEGLYEVSDLGRVRSVDRSVLGSRRRAERRAYGIEIKRHARKDGYLMVQLWKGGVHSLKLVHRLVAETFLDNPRGVTDVNHRDGDKANNSAENLEWCSRSENVKHAYKNGLNRGAPKKKVFCSNGSVYESTKEAARQTGLASGNISQCCNGRRNHTGGLRFSYVPFGGDVRER